MSNNRAYKIATISQPMLLQLINNLSNLSNKSGIELGGFVKLLVCNSLIELGGRILLAKELKQLPTARIHEKAIKRMLDQMSCATENSRYKHNKNKFLKYRNGLAHLLVPGGRFKIGRLDSDEHFLISKINYPDVLSIDDEQLINDVRLTFEKIVADNPNGKFQIIVASTDPDEIKWEVVNK